MNGPTIAGTTRAKDTPIATAGMPSAPPLPEDLEALLRRLRLSHIRRRMSRVPWNFGGGPMIIRLRSQSHHDGRHRHSARRHAVRGRFAGLEGASGR